MPKRRPHDRRRMSSMSSNLSVGSNPRLCRKRSPRTATQMPAPEGRTPSNVFVTRLNIRWKRSTAGVESRGEYRGHATSRRRRENLSTKRSRKVAGSRASASRKTTTSPEALQPPRFLPLATGRSPWRTRTPANCPPTATVASSDPASTTITSSGLLVWRSRSPSRCPRCRSSLSAGTTTLRDTACGSSGISPLRPGSGRGGLHGLLGGRVQARLDRGVEHVHLGAHCLGLDHVLELPLAVHGRPAGPAALGALLALREVHEFVGHLAHLPLLGEIGGDGGVFEAFGLQFR